MISFDVLNSALKTLNKYVDLEHKLFICSCKYANSFANHHSNFPNLELLLRVWKITCEASMYIDTDITKVTVLEYCYTRSTTFAYCELFTHHSMKSVLHCITIVTI